MRAVTLASPVYVGCSAGAPLFSARALTLVPHKPGHRETRLIYVSREPGRQAAFAPWEPGPVKRAGIQTPLPCIPGCRAPQKQTTKQAIRSGMFKWPVGNFVTQKHLKAERRLLSSLYQSKSSFWPKVVGAFGFFCLSFWLLGQKPQPKAQPNRLPLFLKESIPSNFRTD
jgi:hypothetical protein